MFYSDCMVLKLCVVFLQVMSMAKQVMLLDSHNITFKIFCLEAANENPQSLILHKLKFPVKKVYFLRLEFTSEIFARKGKTIFLRHENIF